ncbi:MAG TPA: hypothetical protein VFV50_15160, partial [Bdellovibrionales bacterium]|nr:hypothetical protein [Bdellovibrionales bacterium]
MKTILLIWVLGFAWPLLAAEPDAEGCKDSKLVNRMPGCRIYECAVRDFDQTEIHTGFNKDESTDLKTTVEGAVERIVYECQSSISPFSVVKNFEGAFKAKGFTVVYSGDRSYPYGGKSITLKRGGQYVESYAYLWQSLVYYEQTIVTPETLRQYLEVNAAYLEGELKKSSRVAVYGIEFELNKATLKPDSEKVLSEVLAVLKNNSAWRMRIEGHTDATGTKSANAT